jgi:hypothetical protein
MRQRRGLRRFFAGLAFALAPASIAVASSFEILLSVVFFENEFAYKDPETFICRHIALTADGDYCHASLKILDPGLCKVEIVREIRATWRDGRARDFILAKDVFTLANLDLKRTEKELLPDQKAARMRLEGIGEVYRHEGYSYSFDLDPSGMYASCRAGGESLEISEQDCIERGTGALKPSNKMALLYAEQNFEKGIDALGVLLSNYCPRKGIRS